MTTSFALLCIILGIGAANAHDGSHVNTTQCHKCLEDDFDLCVNQSTIENCTNPATESCFSAAGRYKFTNGSTVVLAGVSRGCIACPNVTAGCAAFKTYFDAQAAWSLQDCNITCCKGDLCNNETVSLTPLTEPPTATNAMSNTTDEPTTAGHLSRYSPTTTVLAFGTIFAIFFF